MYNMGNRTTLEMLIVNGLNYADDSTMTPLQ